MPEGDRSMLPRNFTDLEIMRMMFGEEFLCAATCDGFDGSKEESDIFKDVFLGNKLGTNSYSGNGFEIVSGTALYSQELDARNNVILGNQNEEPTVSLLQNDICEPNPSEEDLLGFQTEDPVKPDLSEIDPEIDKGIEYNCNSDAQNENFSGNNSMLEFNADMHPLAPDPNMGPSEVDLYVTMGGNLSTTNGDFIDTDPLEFDEAMTLHTQSAEDPLYGNMDEENDKSIGSGPLDYDLDMDNEVQEQFCGGSGENPATGREPKSLSKDLSDQLRAHANRLLTEAGWQIDPRKRSDRAKLAAYYKYPPNELIFTTFSRAWRTCGEILQSYLGGTQLPLPQGEESPKEWSDVSTFWVDLAETFSRLEQRPWGPVVGLSLFDRWRSLDPFIAVVCIDKKVHVLRNRGTLQVVGSETVVVSEGRRKKGVIREENAGFGDPYEDSAGDGIKSKGRRVKRKKCSCGDNGSCQEMADTCLVACKYSCSVVDGGELEGVENSPDVGNLDYELLRSPLEAKLVNNSIKKARKRSKRISEIDIPGINGETSDIKPLKKPRTYETKPKARRWSKIELPENYFPENHLTENILYGNHFTNDHLPENHLQETSFDMESGLTKSVPDSIVISNSSSNIIESPQIDSSNFTPPKRKRGPKPKKQAGPKPKNGRKRPRGFHIYDDDLLITAIIKNKDFNSSGKFTCGKASQQTTKRKYKMQRLRRTPKRKFQLALRNKGGNKSKKNSSGFDSRRLILARKTVLSWLIATGGILLNEVVQYRNVKSSDVLKEGWVTLDGILCNCCARVMSLSEFKAHAGPRCQRSGNLFLQSGKSFTLCQLEAWSAEYRLRRGADRASGSGSGSDKEDQNDDTCALCGDGGELLCCDRCPSTYHPSCLPSQEELPEGSWYCWHCICQSCGNAIGGKADMSTSCDLKCLQCGDSYHDTCIGGITCDGEMGPNAWFCGMSCQEIYQWLRSHVGVANFFDDGLSWTLLRCNHEEQKVHSAQRIALMAECNTKLAVALTLMEECFVPMVDPRTGIDMIPHVLYNRGSNFARLDYKGFYTVVLEKGDDIVSVASLRIHGNRVAEMPLVATNTEYRRQGMCRRLVDTIERMLKSFRVKLLVLSAIPDLVETWVTGFGFKPIEENEKKLLNNITLMLFPGASILTKSLLDTESEKSGRKKDLYEKELDASVEESNYHNFAELSDNLNSRSGPSGNGKIDLGMDPNVKPMTLEPTGPVDHQVMNLVNSTEN
ncbi:hypothetical protein LUZ63_012483 [Rhynchospora breviuscula]|uniref:Increased DNA methylation 1 n=1 Tax=Rhynchospora breviuscula TaxID=2022672 RepID=A0A9Q0CKU4_9POAL|nr:hypothetical protein LUZ63_012483 [Rhynchospora breviuscula]